FKELPKTPTFHDDPLNESSKDSASQGSSSNVIQIYIPFEHLGRWTKDHHIANVIGDPSRSISTRKQLETDAMWCYFDAFISSVEPKNLKQAMTEPSWIDAMQEEIHEFKRLKVWELVSSPDNVFLIKLKWIYKIKKMNLAGHSRIRLDLLLKDSDKKRVSILRNHLHRKVYVSQPKGFVDQDNPSHVYKLKKALYDLKQAPHAWYDMLSSFLISQQSSKGEVDPTLFTWHVGDDLLLDTDMSFIAYEDADHAGFQDTRRSISGSARFLGDKLVSWSSKKQKSTAIL
nr:hypothetical protein [Tanacetum cinerariifolium]